MYSRAAWKSFQKNNFLLENVDSTVLKSPLGTCQACHNCGWKWDRLVGLQRDCVALPDPSPASWVDDRLKKNVFVMPRNGGFQVCLFCKLCQIFDFFVHDNGKTFCPLTTNKTAILFSCQLKKCSTLTHVCPFRQNPLLELPLKLLWCLFHQHKAKTHRAHRYQIFRSW